MSTLLLVTTHLPLHGDALPEALVVATITTDVRFTRGQNPTKILGVLAGKLGLLQYAIVDGSEVNLPGHQLSLFKA